MTPLLAWCLTGLVFLIQPGYGAAYEPLSVRAYSLTEPLTVAPQEGWLEYKIMRTTLGTHLLVRSATGWSHLNANTLEPFEADLPQRRSLVSDAIALKSKRYGHLLENDSEPFLTSTGTEIRLQWNTLSLQQYGVDTRWIDRMYSVHYLQWTGVKTLDKVLGIFGLLLLILISITGVRLLLRSNNPEQAKQPQTSAAQR